MQNENDRSRRRRGDPRRVTSRSGASRRAGSRRLTERDAALIKKRLNAREFQHRIAADYGVNQGRISEINTGKRFSHVKPAD